MNKKMNKLNLKKTQKLVVKPGRKKHFPAS